MNDLIVGIRSLWRRPSSSVPAVLALALALGLATATYGIVHAFLFRPLAISAVEEVVRLRESEATAEGENNLSLAAATVVAWRREASDVLSGLAAATGGSVTLTGSGDPERLQAGEITADFFGVLGIQPLLGRDFAAGEDTGGHDGVLLLSWKVWDQRFQRDPNVLGRVLMIDGVARTVIGIMPRNLHHPYSAEIWLPLRLDTLLAQPSGNFLYAPARLRPGVSLEQADARLDAVAAALNPPSAGAPARGAHLTPLREELLGDLQPVLWLLLAGAGFVLLIAVLNVANLMYARGILEGRDTAVRAALGARPHDLFRRALAGNLALVGIATVLGIGGAALVMGPLIGLSGAASIDEFDAVARLDTATLGFAIVTALLVAAVLASIEARRATRIAPATALGAQARGGSLGRSVTTRLRALVTVQCALSFVVAASAALVTGAYQQLVGMDRGHRTEGTWLANVSFPLERYPDIASRERFIAAVEARLRAVPGVAAAGAVTVSPDFPGSWGAAVIVPGREMPDPPGFEYVNHRLASAGYFEALGIPLRAGRSFDAAEPARDAGSVIISEDFAREMWPGQEPIGQRLVRRTRQGPRDLMVVGVVGDVKEAEQSSGWTVTRTWYLPTSDGTDYDFSGITFAVHAERALPGLARQMQEAVWAVDRDIAVAQVMPMRERLAETYSRERFSGFLYGMFGTTALAIAMVGLYGALAFLAAALRREYGIRLALGAPAARIVATITGSALGLTALGVALGAPLAWWLAGRLTAHLEGVGVVEPASFVLPAAALLLAGLLAAIAPARDAGRVDPMTVLREE
jgi:putative ABC transport system permease protein